MGKTASVETLKLENPHKAIFLLYVNQDLKDENSQIYQFFISLSLSDDHKDASFYIIDYDLHEEVKCSKHEIKVEYYLNSKLVSSDFYAEKKESMSWCLAKSPSISKLSQPLRTIPIDMKCPGLECSNKTCRWKCEKCKQDIEYGYDSNFYCECGGAPADSYAMKCSSPYHPNAYLKYSRDELSKHLPNSFNENDTEEVNILLLGETGVGKSTFINGLINYLTYATFDEAMSGDLKVAIPCQFSVPDDDYEDRLIKL